MENVWPFMFLTGICCVVPIMSFSMGVLVGKKGSPLHVGFGWRAKKAREPQADSEAFRWEEAGR